MVSYMYTDTRMTLKRLSLLQDKRNQLQATKQSSIGFMTRNALGGYENKRSYNLQKVKEMQDAEFLITGVESGRGKREGQAVLVLQNEAGQEFRASPKGNDAFRIRLLKDAKNVIGKMATIQFQNLSGYGVPRFGVAKCVRDYE